MMKAGIAGGGIMGRLLAYALWQAGWDVSLFDKESDTSCSMAAAGLLTPVTELEKNDLCIYHLGSAAISTHWPALAASLGEDIYFRQQGCVVVAHPRDQSELIRFASLIADKLGSEEAFQKLTSLQVQALEPHIAKFNEGYFFPNEGQLDCQTLMKVLGDKLQAITWEKATWVKDVQAGKIITDKGTHTFDMVFDCRGLGAKSAFSDLRSVRGELVWLHAPEVMIQRPVRFLHPRYSLYIVPRPNHTYLIGASEIESQDTTAISVRTLLELLTAAYYLHPGFAEARVIKTVTQCRPTLANHLPKIKYQPGFIAVNGLYRHGYLIAPTLMNEVMQWLSKGMAGVEYQDLWEKCA